MDSFIKNIKKKLSVDNLVDMMKDSKVIDEDAIKEEDVRNTLSKLDPNTVMDVDEMAGKLNELADEAAAKNKPPESGNAGKRIIDAVAGIGSRKNKEEEEKTGAASSENDYLQALGREENVFKLYDDFN